MAVLLALLQTGLSVLILFYSPHLQARLQATLLLLAVGMAATLIMLAAHKAVLVVLAAEGGGLAPPVLAVLELLDKETLAAQPVHLMVGVEVVQELLVLPTLMVAQVLHLLFLEL
jgi:hypothetical protein